MNSDNYVLAACFQVKALPNNVLELTGDAAAETRENGIQGALKIS